MTTFTAALQLGQPVAHRGIVIAPLFPRSQPRAAYVTLDEALPLGFRVTEVSAAGLVPELLARNPLDAAVLLYDGEELVGAKQNRILNVTVLVPARSETVIPVSCVEQGRWSARSVAFSSARHTAHPELRRVKAEVLLARD
ncbi:MAG: ARPP-1 family domain-containing protein, partial [Gaiellaceae bacterium]